MTLREACSLLGVKDVTLRHWANQGIVKTVRTPGGHRRFFSEQIQAMLSQRSDPPPVEGQRLEERALRKTRRRLGHGGRARQAWMEGIEPETFGRFRVYGRHILSLVGRWKSDTRARRQILDEARLLGNEYASAMAAQGRGLEQTLSAFLFFRNSVLEALPGEARAQAMAVTDQVMLGAVGAFEKMARSQPA